MNELEGVLLLAFTLNCILNILVLAYFRTVIKEEKHVYEYFCEISKYWHKYLKMRGWEEEE